MRVRVSLQVECDHYDLPTHYPQKGCGAQQFETRGTKGERKALRDPQGAEVMA
jgi:hypothetical protein